jgi:hypothetical protein
MKTLASTFSKWRPAAAIAAAWMTTASFFGVGCGKVGDPVPPAAAIRETTQRLEARQRGGAIELRWPRPKLTGRSSGVARVDIYRRIERTDAPGGLDEEIFLTSAQIIGSLNRAQLNESGQFVFYEDVFNSRDPQLATQRVRYAIRYLDDDGRPNPLSNYAVAFPTSAAVEPPTDLAHAVSQSAVTLSWKAPERSIDGSPVRDVSYNVYRRAPNEAFSQPLNPSPLTEPRFVDSRFAFKAEYVYMVRAVAQSRGEAIESRDSAMISVTPLDTFAPGAPQNVTVASAAGVVSVFWPSNPEPDVKGYFVYRVEASDATKPLRLTPAPIAQTTFQDKTGKRGKTYRYQITAVDGFGNESPRSEPATVEVAN